MLLVIFATFSSCKKDEISDAKDYKQEMRNFVIGISEYAKAQKSGFAIIPQNGIPLVTNNGEASSTPNSTYLAAIDGHGQEDLFYGYENDNQETDIQTTNEIKALLNISKNDGNTILVTDYCSTPSKMDDSYALNAASGYISFAADRRDLDKIPDYPSVIKNENSSSVTKLYEAKNFLYLINPDNFSSKQDFIQSVTATNYDLIIMDLFFLDGTEFTAAEVAQLRAKANGGERLVVCYMSIGEAEDYRYYWKSDWNTNKPSWLDKENPDWAGNFKVKYWDKDWQSIMYGNSNSYLQKVLDADFDGVYLDIIDAFEFYEG
jgi:cysteinyl-tRNA synthetase